MTEIETMGMRIAHLRVAKNWTQVDLAQVLKVSRAAVFQWESDTVTNIRPTHLMVLSKVLGTDPFYLVFGKERQPKEGWPMVPVK